MLLQILFGYVCVHGNMIIADSKMWREQNGRWTSSAIKISKHLAGLKTYAPIAEIQLHTDILIAGIPLLYSPAVDAVKTFAKLGVSLIKSVLTMSPQPDLVKNVTASLRLGSQLAQRGQRRPVLEQVWMIEQIKWQILSRLHHESAKEDWGAVGRDKFVKETRRSFVELEEQVISKTDRLEIIGAYVSRPRIHARFISVPFFRSLPTHSRSWVFSDKDTH